MQNDATGDSLGNSTERTAVEGDGGILQPGDDFHGYKVERLLGKGGLGTVWLVRHVMLDTLFALKILDPLVAEEKPEYVKRFVREAKLATRIRHPNLVAVHDAGYDSAKGVYYLVMDYVRGDTLRSTIAFEGMLPEKEAVRIILHVADVLAAAQCFGMVHRDLKPENIMMTHEGVVKLLDLGIAKISDGIDSLKTTANSVFGTPAYISPEQAMDSSTVDTRADVFSLGIILFELLTGQRPYTGKTPSEVLNQLMDDSSPIPDVRTLNAKVSPKVSAALSLMCAKHLEDRLASPKAVIDTFARLGYAINAASDHEVAPGSVGEQEGPTMQEIMAGLATKKNNAAFSLETQDAEIREFVSRLAQKKRRRWMLVGIGVAVVSLAVAVLIRLLR